MTERDGYEHGVPCCVDTWQDDPDTAATSYAGVFGWDVAKGTPPGTDTRYYMCRLRGSAYRQGETPLSRMPLSRGAFWLSAHAGTALVAQTNRGHAAGG